LKLAIAVLYNMHAFNEIRKGRLGIGRRQRKGMVMGVCQTRVFVPSAEPLDDWAETLIGKVFRPLTIEFADHLRWFWLSRYAGPADDSGDCDIAQIPDDCKQGGFHREAL